MAGKPGRSERPRKTATIGASDKSATTKSDAHPRACKFTPVRRREFLKCLSNWGNVTRAARAVDMNSPIHLWRQGA